MCNPKIFLTNMRYSDSVSDVIEGTGGGIFDSMKSAMVNVKSRREKEKEEGKSTDFGLIGRLRMEL